MRIALLGNGKTGSRVNRLASIRGNEVSVFDTNNIPTKERLLGQDVIVSFLPGDAFQTYIPLLIESQVPVISGSTGFHWPDGWESMAERISTEDLLWIQCGNFSLGNLALIPVLELLGGHPAVQNFKPLIQEWHHIQKKDAPSGTALMWHDAFGSQAEIRSYREGDIIGVHELTLSSGTEKITLRHEVSDRDVFAHGALFLADFIIRNRPDIRSGLYTMHDLMDSYKHLH